MKSQTKFIRIRNKRAQALSPTVQQWGGQEGGGAWGTGQGDTGQGGGHHGTDRCKNITFRTLRNAVVKKLAAFKLLGKCQINKLTSLKSEFDCCMDVSPLLVTLPVNSISLNIKMQQKIHEAQIINNYWNEIA